MRGSSQDHYHPPVTEAFFIFVIDLIFVVQLGLVMPAWSCFSWFIDASVSVICLHWKTAFEVRLSISFFLSNKDRFTFIGLDACFLC